MKDAKNPYASDTPEWQLFENMKGSEAQERAYYSDADRLTSLAQKAREKADKYREALKILKGSRNGSDPESD